MKNNLYNSALNRMATFPTTVPGFKKKPLNLPKDTYYPPSVVQQSLGEGWCIDTYSSFGGYQGTGMGWSDFQMQYCPGEPIDRDKIINSQY